MEVLISKGPNLDQLLRKEVKREYSKVKGVTQNKPEKIVQKEAEKDAEEEAENEAEKKSEKKFSENQVPDKIDKLGKEVDKGKCVVKGFDKEVVQSTNRVVEDCGENKKADKKIVDDGAESKHWVKHNGDDGAERKLSSWMVLTKPSSQDGVPMDFVVNKKRNAQEGWDDVLDVTAEVAKA
ncbi:unnamed protein product [Cochlearia groenlandica]